MEEIVDIARKKHIHLPMSIIDDSFAKGRSFPYGTKTSFQRDYEMPGKKDERDLFGGAIVRMGEQLQILAQKPPRWSMILFKEGRSFIDLSYEITHLEPHIQSISEWDVKIVCRTSKTSL
jgi:hypothetical protein